MPNENPFQKELGIFNKEKQAPLSAELHQMKF